MLISMYDIGTSSIVHEQTHEPLLSILSLIVETAVKLRQDGHRVVIVSSGAIGVGLRRMDVDRRPKHLPRNQVCSGCPALICSAYKTAGISSYRTVSAHKSMGQPFYPPSTTSSPGAAYEE